MIASPDGYRFIDPGALTTMSTLSAWGVTILAGDNIYNQHDPGTGDNYIHRPRLDPRLLTTKPTTPEP